jgi:transcriptional regulator with XRE-family HTH domain
MYQLTFTIAKNISIVIMEITTIFDVMTKIGANIKKIRTTKGLSQQAFADLFALTRGNISSYEENRAEPKIETVIQIANYFSIPLNQFITQVLSIHEILKYNGDKLIEDENHIINLHLKQVPFINDAIYMKCCYQELSFHDWTNFPKLVLPEVNNHNMLALSFNPNIPHHESLPQYQMNDVLMFEEVTQDNIHLCQHKKGLFTAEHEIMIGQYEMKDEKMDLVLNDFRRERFDFKFARRFWKLFALYQHQK